MMLTQGTLLQNRYRIVQQIGGGGMGTVYLAEDTRLLGHRCAIKEMSPAQLPLQDRAWAIQAFQQEAQMLANLRHPGLTAVTDFFLEGSDWYLVMDYVDGEALDDRLQRSPQNRLPLYEALGIARQLCDVMGYLHSQNPPVIFRDLKPGNVMLTPGGEIRLIDFGIARFFKPGQRRDTVNLGTPGYAAPEQYGGQVQTDPRSDVYSLGVLLHQMVTGYDPTTTPFNLPPVRTLNASVPVQVEAAIQCAMQTAPDSRFQDVGDLSRALFESPPPPLLPPTVAPLPRRKPSSLDLLLQHTLKEAQEFLFPQERHAVLTSVRQTILNPSPTSGNIVALVGDEGVGTTMIVDWIWKELTLKAGPKLITPVDLRDYPDQVQVIQEIQRSITRNRISLPPNLRLSGPGVVPPGKNTFMLEAQLPFVVNLGMATIGDKPLKITTEHERTAASEPGAVGVQIGDQVGAGKTPSEYRDALRDLLDALVAKKVRVVLLLDKINDEAWAKLLMPVFRTPGVTSVLVVDTTSFGKWTSRTFITPIYIERKWRMAEKLLSYMVGQNPDLPLYYQLIHYLDFRAQGLPKQMTWALTPYYYEEIGQPDTVTQFKRWWKEEHPHQPHLVVSEHQSYAVAALGDLHACACKELENTLNAEDQITPELTDTMRAAVYQSLHWMASEASGKRRFGFNRFVDKLLEHGFSGRKEATVVASSIVERLKAEGRVQTTKQGLDATAMFDGITEPLS